MINLQTVASDVAAAITEKLNGAQGVTTSGQSSELKAIITAALRKMQVVPRDEFDAQTAVLLRTRQKLEALEKQVAELENKLDQS